MLDDVGRQRVRTMLVVAVLATIGVVVVYFVAVHTHWGRQLDQVAYEGRAAASPRVTRATERFLSSITESSLALLGLALFTIAIARQRVRLAFAVVIAIGGAVSTTEILKHRVFERPPDADVGGLPFNTYPSGHATIGMTLALGLIVVVSHHWRWLASIVAAVVATAFGTAVLTSGWHRPSDSIGAYLVSLAWFCAVMAALIAWRGRGDPAQLRADITEEHANAEVTAVAGIFVLIALALVLARSLSADGLHTVPYSRAYVLVSLGIDLAGVLVVGVFHLLMRDVSPDPRTG